MPELAHRPEMAVRFTIDSQASSPISEAITSPNMNFQFEIRYHALNQPQGMSTKTVFFAYVYDLLKYKLIEIKLFNM